MRHRNEFARDGFFALVVDRRHQRDGHAVLQHRKRLSRAVLDRDAGHIAEPIVRVRIDVSHAVGVAFLLEQAVIPRVDRFGPVLLQDRGRIPVVVIRIDRPHAPFVDKRGAVAIQIVQERLHVAVLVDHLVAAAVGIVRVRPSFHPGRHLL